MLDTREAVRGVLKTVVAPLHFFAVAILALAGVLIALIWKSALPAALTVQLTVAALVMMFALICLVAVLVVYFPKKLVFDMEAHLIVMRGRLSDNELSEPYILGEVVLRKQESKLIEEEGGVTSMMLLITYDRNRADQDYSGLHKEVKKAGKWWHHLGSTWIVRTDLTPTQWADRLKRHLDDTDHLLVIEIAENYDG